MIPVTLYMLPNGKTKLVGINRPANIEKIAHSMIKAGLFFEVEVLRTGEVSLTFTDGLSDLDIRVVPNNEQVNEAFDSMVESYA